MMVEEDFFLIKEYAIIHNTNQKRNINKGNSIRLTSEVNLPNAEASGAGTASAALPSYASSRPGFGRFNMLRKWLPAIRSRCRWSINGLWWRGRPRGLRRGPGLWGRPLRPVSIAHKLILRDKERFFRKFLEDFRLAQLFHLDTFSRFRRLADKCFFTL